MMYRIRKFPTVIFGYLLLTAITILNTVPIIAQPQAPEIGNRENFGKIDNDEIDEASGLASSRKNHGILWTHNDSGDEPRIFAINTDAKCVAEYKLNINFTDCEDIALGPGPEPGQDYIYIGDIGDNGAARSFVSIYRFAEPSVRWDQQFKSEAARSFDIIKLAYPDGARDSETLMIDPKTRDIYLVSKREDSVGVYCAPYPQMTDGINTLQFVTKLPMGNQGFQESGITSGDISPDGREVLLKDYTTIYYFYREDGKSLKEAFNAGFARLPYIMEPQGEAICWDITGNGYFTLSEEAFGLEAYLYYYPKITSSVKKKQEINSCQVTASPEKITITFPQTYSDQLSIYKYSLCGQLLSKKIEHERSSTHITIYCGNEIPGIYLYIVKIDDEIITIKHFR